MRPPAILERLVGLVWFGVLLGVAFTTEAAPPRTSRIAGSTFGTRSTATVQVALHLGGGALDHEVRLETTSAIRVG